MNILLNKRINESFPDQTILPAKSVLKDVLKLSLPAAVEAFLVCLTGLVDTIMVGSISTSSISAVSVTQQPYLISIMLIMGLSAGITAMIARRCGEKDGESAKKTLRQSIIITVIGSLFTMILLIAVARPLLKVSGTGNDLINDATKYLQIVLAGLVFISIRIIICSAFRASGHTRIPLMLNILANVVNIFFNYCLIQGKLGFPRMEVVGAAIATTIGNFVAFVISVILIFKMKSFVKLSLKDSWRIDKIECKKILKVSSGAFIEQTFMRLGFYILAIIINFLGTEAIAANAVVSGVLSLSFSLTDGFAIGTAALVGKSLGEKREKMAFAYGRMAVCVSFVVGCLMIGMIILFRTQLTDLFSRESGFVDSTTTILMLSSFVIFPQSMQWVTTNILRGAGDIKFTTMTAIISIVIMRPILSLFLCYGLSLGVLGSWLGMFIDQSFRFIVNNHRVSHLKWMKIKV